MLRRRHLLIAALGVVILIAVISSGTRWLGTTSRGAAVNDHLISDFFVAPLSSSAPQASQSIRAVKVPITPAPVAPEPGSNVSSTPRILPGPTKAVAPLPAMPTGEHVATDGRVETSKPLCKEGECEKEACDHPPCEETSCDVLRGFVNRTLGRQPTQQVFLYVSDEYKFAMVHVLKSAGSAVSRFIGRALCPDAPKHFCDNRWMERGTERLLKLGSDYFVFGVVRNPFDRYVSIYNFGVSDIFSYSKTKTISFERFCEDPKNLMSVSRLSPVHWATQSNMLLTKQDELVVDYIARFEYLEDDLRPVFKILRDRGASEIWDAFVRGDLVEKNKMDHDVYTTYYDGCPVCYERVSHKFWRDMKLFGYPDMKTIVDC
eukprot:Rmarinus@m.5420